MQLPELLARTVTFKLGEHTFTANKLTLLQQAQVTSETDAIENKNEAYVGVLRGIKFLYTAMKPHYEELTEEYVASLLTDDVMEDASNAVRLVTGGIDPKVPAGSASSEQSPTA